MRENPVLCDNRQMPSVTPALPFCQICERFIQPGKAYARTNGWSYYRCEDCGLIILHPLPDESALRTFYNEDYTVDSKHYAERIRRASRAALEDLRKYCPDRGSLLEIGCSYGGFLAEARLDGWQVTGIELSRAAAAYARDQHQLKIFSGDLRSALSQLEVYDAVVLFHVIEHVPEPMQFLLACRKILKPGGLLVLKTPNASSLIAKLSGSFWQWVSAPAHLCLYGPDTLAALLQKSGYKPLIFRSAQGDANNNLFATLSSVVKRAFFRNNSESLPTLRRSLPVRVAEEICELAYLPCRILLDPLLDRKLHQAELYILAVNNS
jgi:SAM-dependent methyltransferase